MLVTTLLLGLAMTASMSGYGTRYGFYRNAHVAGRRKSASAESGRRVYGGRSVPLSTWGAVCTLLDRYWLTRCSGAVLAPRWVLTAAHCVTPQIAYVKYNTRHTTTSEGDMQSVQALYRHPEYKVVQEDEGRGEDVTLLHHDVGLVQTRRDMQLDVQPTLAPLTAMALYDAVDIWNDEVEVLGFGRTEQSTLGEELFSTRLQLVSCERGGWYHCACGVGARGGEAGVCAGDSGGPVLYRGTQVGVTSMGPLECAESASSDRVVGASVFTLLARYAVLINGTIHSAEELRMEQLSVAPAPRPPAAPLLLALTAVLLQAPASR